LTKSSEIESYSHSSFHIGKLVGIKASLSKKHAKSADILEFYEMIGTNPEETNELYYMTKPSEIEHYSQSSFQIGKLVGIKASLSKKHAKKVLTYARFYEKIGTNPVVTSELYYLTKPGEIEHYSQSLFQRVNFVVIINLELICGGRTILHSIVSSNKGNGYCSSYIASSVV